MVVIDESFLLGPVPMMKTPPPETFPLASGPALVEWRRSTRARRVSIRVSPAHGTIVVTLPLRASRAAGLNLLRDHADWVEARLAALPEALPFTDGALVPINGVPHRIRHRPDARGGAWMQDGELHVSGDADFVGRRVRDFLHAEARRRLTNLAFAKAGSVGRQPRRLTVKDTRSRWGSCSSDGSLAF